MSSNTRCTCSAIFATNDDLEAHFEEQTFLKVALEKTKASVTAALDRCSAHAAAKIENTQDGNGTSTTQGRHCPYAGCTRRDAFSKRKELRIHFRQHVGCNEVCQCCAQRFMLASQFLRHTPNILQMDDNQAAYVTDRRERMVKRVDNELRQAESKKRSREAEDACMDAPKRTKLTGACAAPAGGQHDPSAMAPPASSGTRVEISQHIHDLTDSTQISAPWSEGENGLVTFDSLSSLAVFNAPVHSEINWLSWVSDPSYQTQQ